MIYGLYNSTNDIKNKKEQAYLRLLHIVGAEKARYLLQNVPMSALFECMYTASNSSFHKAPHREIHMSVLDGILLRDVFNMYRSVTYGTAPNATCRYNIGSYTGMRYKNCDIAYLLIQIKADELRTWLLNTYKFNDREKRLLRGLKND